MGELMNVQTVNPATENELIERIKQHISSFKMGDPLDPTTNLGPLARSDLRETVHKQVEKSLKQGAKLLLGGIIPDGQGFFYPPTLLTQVSKEGILEFVNTKTIAN
jgi:succinate-semialdehyde dehydrogenase/glutarate-semialdehyde dehydrogenase